MRATERLISRGFEAYLVGGCVRDLLLGRTPKDYDIATEARPPQVKRVFPRNCRIIGRRFKLAHLHFHGNSKILECSTFRQAPSPSENGEDILITRDNEFGTAEEDALRRDFTVNALFLDPTRDTILDYTDGLRDVHDRVIRTIGNPVVRFREDPVRILRAAKFAGRLGFTVDAETFDAMAETSGDLLRSAPPRVLEEILRLLRGGHALDSFQLLRDVGALKALLPVLADFLAVAEHEERVDFWHTLDALDRRILDGAALPNGVLLGALLVGPVLAKSARNPGRSASSVAEDVLGPLCAQLRLPKRDAGCLKRICGVQNRFLQPSDSKRFRTEGFLHSPYFPEAYELFELRIAARGQDATDNELDSRDHWRGLVDGLEPPTDRDRDEPAADDEGLEDAALPLDGHDEGEPTLRPIGKHAERTKKHERAPLSRPADEPAELDDEGGPEGPIEVAASAAPTAPAGDFANPWHPRSAAGAEPGQAEASPEALDEQAPVDEGDRRRRRRRRRRGRGNRAEAGAPAEPTPLDQGEDQGQSKAAIAAKGRAPHPASVPGEPAEATDDEPCDAPASVRARPMAADFVHPEGADGALDVGLDAELPEGDVDVDVDVEPDGSPRPPVEAAEADDLPRHRHPTDSEQSAPEESGSESGSDSGSDSGSGDRKRRRRRRRGRRRGGAADPDAPFPPSHEPAPHGDRRMGPQRPTAEPDGGDPASESEAFPKDPAAPLPEPSIGEGTAGQLHDVDDSASGEDGPAGEAAVEGHQGTAQGDGPGAGRRRRRRRGRRGRGRHGDGAAHEDAPRQQGAPGQPQQPRHQPQPPRQQQQQQQPPRQQQQRPGHGQRQGHGQRDGGQPSRREERRRDRRHGGPRDVDVVPRHRDRRGKVEVIEPTALDLSAFDVELDPKRVPTFGSIVEGKGRPKRRSPRVPDDGVDDYRPPPPPGSDGAPPPPPPPSNDTPDTFGDW